ncbi:unnamed protein product [Lactuca saligna]|uniref:Uncharacterized protein n=1 Tax=Lactuca saligna TaxID=75948 RepID=A0AA35ZQR9_LACSI|nr:unnamed protein product [Lactuca saligna]
MSTKCLIVCSFYTRLAAISSIILIFPYIVIYFLLIWFTPPPKHRRHSSLHLQHHPSLQPPAPPSFSPKQPTPPTSAQSFDWVLKILASLKNLHLMDPKYTGEMLKHLEKQDELLMDAYRSMSHELHKLQVEEEMLMRAFYDLMASQGLATKRQDGTSVLEDIEPPQSKSLVNVDSNKKH